MTIVAQWEIIGNEKISNKWLLSARNRELISAEHIFGNEVCQAFCTRINLSVKAMLQFNMEIMKRMFHRIQALVRWKEVRMFSCYLARNGVCHNSWFPILMATLHDSYSCIFFQWNQGAVDWWCVGPHLNLGAGKCSWILQFGGSQQVSPHLQIKIIPPSPLPQQMFHSILFWHP